MVSLSGTRTLFVTGEVIPSRSHKEGYTSKIPACYIRTDRQVKPTQPEWTHAEWTHGQRENHPQPSRRDWQTSRLTKPPSAFHTFPAFHLGIVRKMGRRRMGPTGKVRPSVQLFNPGDTRVSSNNITIELHLHAAVDRIQDALDMVPKSSNEAMKLRMARELIESVESAATSDRQRS